MNLSNLSLSILLCAGAVLVTTPSLAQSPPPETPKLPQKPHKTQPVDSPELTVPDDDSKKEKKKPRTGIIKPINPGLNKQPVNTDGSNKPQTVIIKPETPKLKTKNPKTNNTSQRLAVSLYNSAKALQDKNQNLPEARKKYKQSADMGYAPAQYSYAKMVYMNHGGSIEGRIDRESLAIEYYRKAVRQNHPEAQWDLAELYLKKAHAKLQDFETATPLLMKLAAKDHVDATMLLADCYAYGKGVKLDFDRAMRYYKKAIELEQWEAYTKIGRLILDQDKKFKDYESARLWFRQGYKKNVLSAQAEYGKLLITMKDTQSNQAEGLRLLEIAALRKSPTANYILYELYDEGRHVDKNEIKAMQHLRDAMRTRYPAAAFKMASILEAPGETQRNKVYARTLYQLAARNDILPAQLLLLDRMSQGKQGFALDTPLFHYWAKRVAKRTLDPDHSFLAGTTAPNEPTRLAWFRIAESQGSYRARIERLKIKGRSPNSAHAAQAAAEMINLYNAGHLGVAIHIGHLYYYSPNHSNITKALEWYVRAGENGDAQALRRLGTIYARGDRFPKDMAIAELYFKRAATAGDYFSMMELATAHDTQPNSLRRGWVLGFQSLDTDAALSKHYWITAAKAGSRQARQVVESRKWTWED